MDAAVGIRHPVSYADQTQLVIRILSLDSGRPSIVSHDYLYHILSENGFVDTSVGILRALYRDAISRCDVNGFLLERL
jgi:hypothetical protein